MADEEFATIKENAGLNATVTVAIVLFDFMGSRCAGARSFSPCFACLVVGFPSPRRSAC